MPADYTATPPLVLTMAQACELGDRASNQDFFGSALQDELACFVVSDGVGGQQGGEIASQIVVEAILSRFKQESVFGERALRSYFDFAVSQVAARKTQEPRLKDMSATVATVLIDCQSRQAQFAHLGDTRIYLFRHKKRFMTTKDHSLVQQFIDAGYCAPDQLRVHALRSTLFAAVGIESETPIEAIDAPVTLEAGDALLICTDGFWEWIEEAAMEAALLQATDVDDWLDRMTTAAAAGNHTANKQRDNSTALAIWLGSSDQHDHRQSPS